MDSTRQLNCIVQHRLNIIVLFGMAWFNFETIEQTCNIYKSRWKNKI